MTKQRMIYSGAIMAAGGLMLAVCGIILTSAPSTAPGFAGILMLIAGGAGFLVGLGLAITGIRRAN